MGNYTVVIKLGSFGSLGKRRLFAEYCSENSLKLFYEQTKFEVLKSLHFVSEFIFFVKTSFIKFCEIALSKDKSRKIFLCN